MVLAPLLKVLNGGAQGSVLGPLLFFLYTSLIEDMIKGMTS